MMSAVRTSVLLVFLIATTSAWADDQLPRLQSGGPESLPSLGTTTMSSVSTADQNLSVTCYLGNPNDRQSLGSLTVHSSAEAGSVCNSMNFACKGRCFGCYSDFDLSEDICVDNSGRRFLK